MSPTQKLIRAFMGAPVLWLVPAALLHPSRQGHRVQSALAATAYVIRTILLRRASLVRVGEHSRILGYPGEFNPLHAVVRNPPNNELVVWRRRLSAGDRFIDVGANIGLYTIYAIECGASVVAIEPDPSNADRIREHLTLNGVRAEVLQKALDRAPGAVVMTTDLNDRNHLLPSGSEGRVVEATTLDEVIGDGVAMVKIDVEGAEDAVLAGGLRALRERRIPLMQLEWGIGPDTVTDNRQALQELLTDVGYELYEHDRAGNLIPLDGRAPAGLNVFAMPA